MWEVINVAGADYYIEREKNGIAYKYHYMIEFPGDSVEDERERLDNTTDDYR